MSQTPTTPPPHDPLLVLLRPPDRRVRWVSLGAAVGLHLALGLAAFLHVVTMEPPPPDGPIVRVPLEEAILIPPPPPEPILRQRHPLRRLSPVPDPRPDEPEPIVDEIEEIVFTPAHDLPETAWTEGLLPPEPEETRELTREMVPPRIIAGTRVEPRYPPGAQRAGIEGDVLLRAVIRRDGTVGSLEVVQAPRLDLGFSEEALAAVARWRYRPALLEGRPVEVYFTIAVGFRLDD